MGNGNGTESKDSWKEELEELQEEDDDDEKTVQPLAPPRVRGLRTPIPAETTKKKRSIWKITSYSKGGSKKKKHRHHHHHQKHIHTRSESITTRSLPEIQRSISDETAQKSTGAMPIVGSPIGSLGTRSETLPHDDNTDESDSETTAPPLVQLGRSFTVGSLGMVHGTRSERDLLGATGQGEVVNRKQCEETQEAIMKLNTFDEQLKINERIFLRILSFTRPLDQLHLCLVCKQFRFMIYYKKLIPGLKIISSVKYYCDKYSVYYDSRRKSLKLNLSESLDIPQKCRLQKKSDKKRLILFLLFQSEMKFKATDLYTKHKEKQGLLNVFEDTWSNLERLEVAWFQYARSNPLGWLESLVVSPFTQITILDLSESNMSKSSIDGLIKAISVRISPSPIVTLNLTGNANLDDESMCNLLNWIGNKMPNLKTLYLDYTGVGDGTCTGFHELYTSTSYISDKNMFLRSLTEDDDLGVDAQAEAKFIRLKRVSMEGTVTTINGIYELDKIFKESRVSKEDTIKFNVKINWSPEITKKEKAQIQSKCDTRIKFY